MVDITPKALKTQEGIQRNIDATKKWEDTRVAVANGAMHLLKDKSHIIEMGIVAALKSGHMDEDWAAEMRDDLQTLKADIEEMQIAQENFLRSISGRPEYNPARHVKRPE